MFQMTYIRFKILIPPFFQSGLYMETAVPFTDSAVEKRVLSTPTTPPIRIDEHENLARSIFGANVANVCKFDIQSDKPWNNSNFVHFVLFYLTGTVYY